MGAFVHTLSKKIHILYLKKDKTLSMLLCSALLLLLLPSAAYAVDVYTTSEEGIALIKEFEGFSSKPYELAGTWAVGYGHTCDPLEYPNGITQEEADLLLMEDVAHAEDIVNTFLLESNVTVTQYQFDALVDLTYNVGTQWLNEESRIYSYLCAGIDQYSEYEIVNALGAWCHVGSTVMENLVNRRLRESYLLLYGLYENDAPSRYTYIHFMTSGGTLQPSTTIFYALGEPYGKLPVPTKDGSTFLGWYDEQGEQLTPESYALWPIEVTAMWEAQRPALDLSSWVNPYSDVKTDDWFYSYVRELSAGKIMNGYPDGTFLPQQTLKNGEALKLILNATGQPDAGNADEGHWASGYLAAAEALGCVEPGEIQDLDAPISRWMVAKITAIAMDLGQREGSSPFIDADSGYLLALYEEGIITGSIYDGYRWFYPADNISRAEMCAIVARVYDWNYVEPETEEPSNVGYITYRNNSYPILPNVPVCPYNKDLFVLDGSVMYYHDDTYTTELGIDVSRYQEDIDWQQVAADGIQFAIIRLGYRGYGAEGTLNLDANFEKNYAGATAAGIKVGVYFFSQATTVAEALEEATYVLETLGGRPLTYPVVCDWESVSSASARTAHTDAETATDCVITFCEAIRTAGYIPMTYYNLYDGYERLELDRLTAYDSWFAQYAEQPEMYYAYRIWQYSDKGKVAGIEGNVDMDLAFIPYE